MALKRIGTFTKKRTVIEDKKSGRKNEYFIIRLPFDDVPGKEGAPLDVWSDTKLGYMRFELAQPPKH